MKTVVVFQKDTVLWRFLRRAGFNLLDVDDYQTPVINMRVMHGDDNNSPAEQIRLFGPPDNVVVVD